FAHDADHRRLRLEQRAQDRIAVSLAARLARHAERGQLRVLQRQRLGALEELDVLRVRPRIAALDEVNPEAVQQARNLQLVLDRERESLALCSVAQRRVEELDVHGYSEGAQD